LHRDICLAQAAGMSRSYPPSRRATKNSYFRASG
jgi:hypothetical protein